MKLGIPRTVALGLASMAMIGTVGVAPAAAGVDTTPPSVPRNLHSTGLAPNNTVLAWDASTDDSGSIYHYWVLVDGAQKARPAGTSYDVRTLVELCRIPPGTHTFTVQAVDRALNRSAPSNPVQITVS